MTTDELLHFMQENTILRRSYLGTTHAGYVSEDKSYYIFCNIEQAEIDRYGFFEQAYHPSHGFNCQEYFLEKHFVDVLKPLPEELVLWELEMGYAFPLVSQFTEEYKKGLGL